MIDPTLRLTPLTIVRSAAPVAGKRQAATTIAVAHFDVQPFSPDLAVREQLPGIGTDLLYQWYAIYWTDDATDQYGDTKPDVRLQDTLRDDTRTNPATGQPVAYRVYGVQDWGDHLEIRAQVLTSKPTT